MTRRTRARDRQGAKAIDERGAGVINQIRALLNRHLPGYEVRSVVRLGEGLDNAVYEVNGELIVRGSKEADPARQSESTRREADLLAVVAELSTLPVPEPVFADIEAGVLVYLKLPGLPLMEQPVAEPARLAPALGGFVGRLHRAPLEKMEELVERDAYPLAAWLRDAERDYQKIAELVPATSRRMVNDFLGRASPAEPRALAFCHNDLGAEHVLVDVGVSAVTGVVDWTDAAIADPVLDFARLYRDLGPDFCDLMLDHYEGRWDDIDRERAAFYARCSLIEDIAFGVENGARPYVANGLAYLARTFGQGGAVTGARKIRPNRRTDWSRA
jgi:aminoglycoside phosphotransferase (APT) family kinase protein